MKSSILYIMETTDTAVSTIAYRERVAWVSIAAFTLPYLPYFAWVAFAEGAATASMATSLWAFGFASGSSALIYGVGRLWLLWQCADEARLPMDERDRAIARRSLTVAYGLLMAGMIVVGGILPFTRGGWEVARPAFLMILLAEVVRDSTVVWCYRRGFHE